MDLNTTIFVEESESLNGVLRFQSGSDKFGDVRDRLFDRYDTLTHWRKLQDLEDLMSQYGLQFHFVSESALDRYRFLKQIVETPFEVDVPFFREGNELYPFQHAGMNLAHQLDRCMIQWDTGAGKTLLGALVAQRLFDEGKIDIVVVLCKRPKKSDWHEYLLENTRLDARRIEGTRDRRHRLYDNWDGQVLVTNYEKVRYPRKDRETEELVWGETDLWQIRALLEGKRVLFVVDEAQKWGNAQSLVSRGMRALEQKSVGGRSNLSPPSLVRIIALTATPYQTSPINIYNIFKTTKPGIPYVSETKDDFETEYVQQYDLNGKPTWNERKLHMLGKRFENHAHIAMKSDPEIAAQFPEMVERQLPMELSEQDQRVYDAITDQAFEDFEDANHAAIMASFQTLRMVCNTSEALRFSKSSAAEAIVDSGSYDLRLKNSSKYQAVEGLAETILDSDEKIVLFTYWANAVLPLYADALQRALGKDSPVFRYWGVGMSTDQQDKAKRGFNEARGGAVLIMSDAGAEGLNLYAPYLAHIEMPYTYANYKQRRDRIHRSDSIAKGIDHVWIYRFLVHGTVEERVDDRVMQRRRQAELIQGRPDVISDQQKLDRDALFRLMFGRDRERVPA